LLFGTLYEKAKIKAFRAGKLHRQTIFAVSDYIKLTEQKTMKFINNLKTYLLICLLAAFVMACNTETRQGANREFEEFTAWMEENSSRADTATEEEWSELQAEYNRRATELEKRNTEWDDRQRAEWEETQARWQETVGRVETRFRASEVEPVDVPEEESATSNF
jgi:hypothetical protein